MMKSLIFILLTFMFATELEIDGNLKVTGNIIFSDSTTQSSAAITNQNFNGIKEFTSSQTWVVPNGVNSLIVELWGAGGGGGSGTNTSREDRVACGGGGGGAGGYVYAVISVQENDSLNIAVGSGGSGGGSGGNGSSGGDTSIRNSNQQILVYSPGGGGGGYSAWNCASAGGSYGVGGSGQCGQINFGVGIVRCGDNGLQAESSYSYGGTSGMTFHCPFNEGAGFGGVGGSYNGDGESGSSGYILIRY